jgi:hypothetical protein
MVYIPVKKSPALRYFQRAQRLNLLLLLIDGWLWLCCGGEQAHDHKPGWRRQYGSSGMSNPEAVQPSNQSLRHSQCESCNSHAAAGVGDANQREFVSSGCHRRSMRGVRRTSRVPLIRLFLLRVKR